MATRQELMAFALTHCPPSSIELLLAAGSSLQTEVSAATQISSDVLEVHFVPWLELRCVIIIFLNDNRIFRDCYLCERNLKMLANKIKYY